MDWFILDIVVFLIVYYFSIIRGVILYESGISIFTAINHGWLCFQAIKSFKRERWRSNGQDYF